MENFEELLQKELDKLPYTKHLDDGQYNDGQVTGFEIGARWALSLFEVGGEVYLTENQIAELVKIGGQYLYLGVMDEGIISYGGIMEIIKKYEEFRKIDR